MIFVFIFINSICSKNNLWINGAWVENFDPITIWIFDECQSFHSAFVWTFHKVDTKLFEAFACRVNIRNQNANVTKTSWIGVSIMVFLIVIWFSTPIAIEKNWFNFIIQTKNGLSFLGHRQFQWKTLNQSTKMKRYLTISPNIDRIYRLRMWIFWYTNCVSSTVALRDMAHFVRSELLPVGTSVGFSYPKK